MISFAERVAESARNLAHALTVNRVPAVDPEKLMEIRDRAAVEIDRLETQFPQADRPTEISDAIARDQGIILQLEPQSAPTESRP